MTTLSRDIADTFGTQGFVFPIDVMTKAEASSYRRALEDFEHCFDAGAAQLQCLRSYPHLLLPFVDEIIRRPAVTDAVAEILGNDLLVLDSSFFIKEPQTTHYVSWHQDVHYWGLESDEEVTAWIALSPATSESGCMRFVPGSQKQVVEHRDTYGGDNLLSRGQEIAVDVDENDAIEVILEPGQMSLHHGRLFHASHANSSDDRRIGLAVRYIPTTMKQAPGARMSAMLVRGTDSHGHFASCSRPTGKLSEADFAYWSKIKDARKNVVLDDGASTSGKF